MQMCPLFTTRGSDLEHRQELWVQKIQYRGTSDTQDIHRNKEQGRFSYAASLIITSGFRKGLWHSNNVWMNSWEQV